MGNLYAIDGKTFHGATQARTDIVEATTAEGNLVTWDISTANAAYALTIREYDATRYSQYRVNTNMQPTIIIKCSVDTSGFNVTVQSSDGAAGTTTHYTFAADYSVTPRFIALRLTEGADGTLIWELA